MARAHVELTPITSITTLHSVGLGRCAARRATFAFVRRAKYKGGMRTRPGYFAVATGETEKKTEIEIVTWSVIILIETKTDEMATAQRNVQRQRPI